MDYSNILQYLQNYLTNQQSTNAGQYQQGLGFQQQQLTAQQQEYNANLANQQALQTLQNTGQLDVTNAQNSGQLANTNAQGQNAINLQAPQIKETGREFDTSTKNALQNQLWNQQFAQQQNQQQRAGMTAGQINDMIMQSLYGSGGITGQGGGTTRGGTGGGGVTPGARSNAYYAALQRQTMDQNQKNGGAPMGTQQAMDIARITN